MKKNKTIHTTLQNRDNYDEIKKKSRGKEKHKKTKRYKPNQFKE
jgi:hypothetical protein